MPTERKKTGDGYGDEAHVDIYIYIYIHTEIIYIYVYGEYMVNIC